MNYKIRVLGIKAKNLKNLKFGEIDFNSKKQVLSGNINFINSDIIGIYGQNGSSKSTIINAFMILKKLIIGNKCSNDLINYIAKDSNECELCISFYVTNLTEQFILDYGATFINEQNKIKITKENIKYKKLENTIWSDKQVLFEVDNNNLDLFLTPITNLKKLKVFDKEILKKLLVLKGQKEAEINSFLFSNEFLNLVKNIDEFNVIIGAINNIKTYAIHCMHIYDNREISKITALDTIPFFYKTEKENMINSTEGYLALFNEGLIRSEYEETIKKFVQEINIVLDKLVPGVIIDIENLGETLDKEGIKCFKYQFVSKKQNFNIPLRLESDGIKKIISILSSLVDAFNNPNAILIIDELDSGIFEFLLGIILDIFKTNGVGQLLFTSHNLRALEVIQDDIIFTTNDADNRFIKMKHVQSSNNLRRKYLKDLYLGQTKNLFNTVDSYEIYQAIKKAGDLCLNAKKQ